MTDAVTEFGYSKTSVSPRAPHECSSTRTSSSL